MRRKYLVNHVMLNFKKTNSKNTLVFCHRSMVQSAFLDFQPKLFLEIASVSVLTVLGCGALGHTFNPVYELFAMNGQFDESTHAACPYQACTEDKMHFSKLIY